MLQQRKQTSKQANKKMGRIFAAPQTSNSIGKQMFGNTYEPTTFDELIFEDDNTRKTLAEYAAGRRAGNILLHGPYGSAKSTVARMIANESRTCADANFDFGVDILNGANFESKRLPHIKRNWLLSGQKYAYAVIDEFDLVGNQKQSDVRMLMDDQGGKNGFIFTTNHLHRIDGAIESRCHVLKLPQLSPKALLPLCKRILVGEAITLADQDILKAIDHEKGDLRRVLRQLEHIVQEVRQRTAA
jgi:replication-associated recombination protein RarA